MISCAEFGGSSRNRASGLFSVVTLREPQVTVQHPFWGDVS